MGSMLTKKHARHVASVVAGAIVYGAAPVTEFKAAAKGAVTPADASHRKDDADARNDEGRHAEHSVAPVRAVGVAGATAATPGLYPAGIPSTEAFGASYVTLGPSTLRGRIEMRLRESWQFILRLLSR